MTDTFCSFTRNCTFVTWFLFPKFVDYMYVDSAEVGKLNSYLMNYHSRQPSFKINVHAPWGGNNQSIIKDNFNIWPMALGENIAVNSFRQQIRLRWQLCLDQQVSFQLNERLGGCWVMSVGSTSNARIRTMEVLHQGCDHLDGRPRSSRKTCIFFVFVIECPY